MAISLLLIVVSAILAVALPDRAALLTVRLIMIFCLLLGGVTCVVTGLRRHGAERVWRLLVAVTLLAWVAVLEDAIEGKGPLGNGPVYSVILAATTLVVAVVVILVAVFRQPRAGGGLGLLITGLLTVTASIMWYASVVVRGLRDVAAGRPPPARRSAAHRARGAVARHLTARANHR